MNTLNTSGTPAPADWSEWKKHWRTTIKHSEFEWDFAMDVIPAVIGLKPSQVTPQHPFVGTDGRQYHMDFAIVTEKVKIAIELEGFDKDNSGSGQSKKQHDEFNRRIQSLTALGWKPLTITNAQFKSDPMHYANMIRQIISGPFPEHSEIANQDNSEILKSIETISGLVRHLDSNSKLSPAISTKSDNSEALTAVKKIGVAGITIIAALLALLIFALTKNGNSPPSTPVIQTPASAPKVYEDCAALKLDYPNGIARTDADRAREKPSATVNKAIYDANPDRDRSPKDGIACNN